MKPHPSMHTNELVLYQFFLQTKRENGVHSNSSCKPFSPVSSAVSSVSEENEIERHYREIGSRIVKMLVERGNLARLFSPCSRQNIKMADVGLIPSSTEHVYREIATSSVERELVVSREGKEEDDDSDLVRSSSSLRLAPEFSYI